MKARTFAATTGVIVGTTGALGMVRALRKQTYEHREEMILADGYGKIAGMIPTNTLFNWVRLGIGITGLLCSRDEKAARVFNRSIAISYAGMAVMGLLPKADTLFGLMPIFGGNVLLHAGTAVGELLTEEELLIQAGKIIPFKKVQQRRKAAQRKSKVGTLARARVTPSV
jgi:hypothetical protein